MTKKKRPKNKQIQAQSQDESQKAQIIRAEHNESFSGPIPPPNILQKYDEILPGAADRILIMAENQASHRQKLEAKVISSDVKNSKIGLFLGFVIALVALAVGFYLAINGMPWPGSLLSFGSIGSLVGIFVYGSRQRRQERAEKRSK